MLNLMVTFLMFGAPVFIIMMVINVFSLINEVYNIGFNRSNVSKVVIQLPILIVLILATVNMSDLTNNHDSFVVHDEGYVVKGPEEINNKSNKRTTSFYIKDVNDELRFIELGPNSKITYKNTDGEFKYTAFRNKLGFFKYTIEMPEDGETVAYINNK